MPDVVGLTSLGGPFGESIVEEIDGRGGFFAFAVHSRVNLFDNEMASRFYQGAYPSQLFLEIG